MKNQGYLVKLASGSHTRKPFADLLPGDRIVMGGPDEHKNVDDANRWLQDQINAAGGFEVWRKQGDVPPLNALQSDASQPFAA